MVTLLTAELLAHLALLPFGVTSILMVFKTPAGAPVGVPAALSVIVVMRL